MRMRDVTYRTTGTTIIGGPNEAPSPPPPPPPPPAQSITLTALDGLSAVAGGAGLNFSAQVANPTALPLNFVLETASGPTATPSPSSSTWSLGDLNKAISAAWAAAGTSVIRVRDANNNLSNSLTVTVSPAPPPPPPAATTLTISITPSTGTTGSTTATVAVTPNGPIPSGGGTASLALSGGGTLGASTLNFSAGSSSPQTTTLSRSADGTSTVTLTNSMGLTNAPGSPATATFTSSAPPPPPPPPPPTGTPQPFTLISPNSGSLVFALGYAAPQGHIPAGQSLIFSGATAKLTVLSTWPDGSVRHGIIAGTYTSAGSAVTVTPTVAVVSAGTLLTGAAVQAAMGANTAVFDCGAFGTATFSGSDFASPFLVHAATDGFIEAIYRKQVGSDAHLVAWIAVRHWAGTSNPEVLPWVENGYLLVASPTNKSATYTFSLGGTQRFSGSIDLLNHQRTPLVSGSALVHWLGTDPGVSWRLDPAYLSATRNVPSYYGTTANGASAVTGLPNNFTPLQQGSYPTGMGSAGYHPSIGPLPEWDVLALTTSATVAPQVYAAIQRNAYSAGRYGIHFRDENTNRPARFSSHPNLVLNGGSEGVSGAGSSTTNTYTPTASGTAPPTYASTHAPALGVMAYLLTGRFYHLETMQFQAVTNFLKQSNNNRQTTAGIFLTTAGANTTRGVGWAIRTLAQVAALTPDADPLAAEFRASLVSNVNYYHTRYPAQFNNPLGWVTPYSNYSPQVSGTTGGGSTSTNVVLWTSDIFTSDDYYNGWELVIGGQVRTVVDYVGATRTAIVSPAFGVSTAGVAGTIRPHNYTVEAVWMQDFVTAAFGYALALQPVMTAANKDKLREFFFWKARSVVGRLGNTSVDEFLYRDAANYTMPVAPSQTPDWNTATGPWFNTWGELYDALVATQGSPGSRTDGDLRGSAGWVSASGYWANLLPALAYCIEHGVPGAVSAYLKMTGASNWAALQAEFDGSPVWGVKAPNIVPAFSWQPAAGTLVDLGVVTGTTQSGSTTSAIVLPSGVSTEDGWYVGYEIEIGGQARQVTAYNGSTRTASVASTFSVSVTSAAFTMRSTLNSAKPSGWPTQDLAGPYANWSGAAYAPDWGRYGAVVHHGSGHLSADTPLWAGVWCYSLEKLKFEGRSVPAAPLLEGAYYNAFGESTQPATLGHIYAQHVYDGAAYQSRLNGGGREGSLWRVQAAGQNYTHRADLSSATAVAQRMFDNTHSGSGYPMVAVDEARGGIWSMNNNGTNGLWFIKFSDLSVTLIGTGYNVYGDNTLIYLPPPFDGLLGIGRGNAGNTQWKYHWCKLGVASPAFVNIEANISGSAPPGESAKTGGSWSELLRAVVCYPAAGSTSWFKLTPPKPGTLHSGAWTWTSEVLTGATPSRNRNIDNGQFGRAQEVPWARCMVTVDSIFDPMQAARLTGM